MSSMKDRLSGRSPAFIATVISHLQRLKPLANGIVEFVLPETCAGCDMAGTWMCDYCREELLDVLLFNRCERCGAPLLRPVSHTCTRCHRWQSPSFRVRSRYVFGGPARNTVHLLKYSGQWARAEWITEEMMPLLESEPTDALLVPVPLGLKRLRSRGFNQAEKIVHCLSERSNRISMDALVRVRETPTQVGLSATERYLNVRDAFECVTDVLGKDVLLVDDVMTTGATLDSCAGSLMRAGAKSVTGLTFAVDAPQIESLTAGEQSN